MRLPFLDDTRTIILGLVNIIRPDPQPAQHVSIPRSGDPYQDLAFLAHRAAAQRMLKLGQIDHKQFGVIVGQAYVDATVRSKLS